ncbi:hypothetical protein GCM10026988_00210 [Vibrio panuliri]|uniref:Uncharacterized protein n=1 Tax=Vibrio panuliri TaxID=1381081 RepID=A0ABX3FRQ6_9VIBR|nr:hypothetical protein BIY20_04500 [Vibrio panuliri]
MHNWSTNGEKVSSGFHAIHFLCNASVTIRPLEAGFFLALILLFINMVEYLCTTLTAVNNRDLANQTGQTCWVPTTEQI